MEQSGKLDFYLPLMTKVLGRANSANQIPGGMCKYLTKYKQGISLYKGVLRDEGPSVKKCTRMIRQVAYGGQEVVDFGVEMAYFALSSQAVGKLRMQIHGMYSIPYTTKAFIAEEKSASWHLQGKVSFPSSHRKRVFREVSKGAAINPELRTERFIR